MGWFWGTPSPGNGDDAASKSQDSLRDLDPSLRDFLDKESPTKYTSSSPRARQPPAITAEPQQHADSKTSAFSPTDQKEKPLVPKESLFQDGRYSQLWKTYQPQAEIEAASKSDQEKISDALEGYKFRKAEIGRAALENCAMEQGDVDECFRTGGWASRLTMCRAESRCLDRCFTMQAKFLKALGYLSIYDRPPEIDEQIQMHADTLYHRMLDQEKEIEAAKAEGRPVPTFPPLLSNRPKFSAGSASIAAATPEKLRASDLSQSVQVGLKKRLEGLSGEERELEERAINAEIAAGLEVKKNLDLIYAKQEEERKKRKEEGKETMADRLTTIFKVR